MESPILSVIMSVYNCEEYLSEAIESILNQTFSNFEFIIVNDASTDDSLQVIQGYKDKRIKIINNEKNIGLTKSLNKALKEAKGKYIARQDADDVSLIDRFEKQVEYLDKNPDVAVVGGRIYLIDEEGKIVRKPPVNENPKMSDFLRENQLSHGAVMFRKAVICDLGAYNEIFRYCQDYELWLRVVKYNKVRNLTDILYKLRSHSENVTFKPEARLFQILALKLAKDELSEKDLNRVRPHELNAYYSLLTEKEKKILYRSLGNLHLSHGNLIIARKYYRQVLDTGSFDIKSGICFAFTFCGSKFTGIVLAGYYAIRNACNILKNLFTDNKVSIE